MNRVQEEGCIPESSQTRVPQPPFWLRPLVSSLLGKGTQCRCHRDSPSLHVHLLCRDLRAQLHVHLTEKGTEWDLPGTPQPSQLLQPQFQWLLEPQALKPCWVLDGNGTVRQGRMGLGVLSPWDTTCLAQSESVSVALSV